MASAQKICIAEQEVARLDQMFERRNSKRDDAARKLAAAQKRLAALRPESASK